MITSIFIMQDNVDNTMCNYSYIFTYIYININYIMKLSYITYYYNTNIGISYNILL